MTEKRKRVELSIKEKLEIIAACDGPPKESFASVARKFDIDRSTVSKIYKKKETLLEDGCTSIHRKRLRSGWVKEVDEALYRWFAVALAADLPITGEILRSKAESFASELGLQSFMASNGWLDRWKRRYGVLCKRPNSESEKVDTDVVAAHQWLSIILPNILQRYEPKDIYNADEMGLYWRTLPKDSEIFRGQLTGDKIPKDRITVLVCASMTGEKRPLLVIGKSKTPRCFRFVESLPVHYYNNENACMNPEIFEDWLRTWDKELAYHKRKIILIVDSCAAHASLEFPHIELVFLPTNVTALIQPCDQGINRALKRHYRHLIVLRLLAVTESSEQDVSALQLIRKIDLLCAVRLLKESWDMVNNDTIVNCFRKAKFYQDNTHIPSLDKDNVAFNKDEIDFDFESFVDVDQDVECIDSLEEKTIKIENKTEPEKPSASVKTNVEELETEVPEIVVTKAMALESLQLLQTFLSKGGVQDWSHFNQLEAQVQQIILKDATKTHQLTIEKWLKPN